jgi:hypothetical protein
MSLENPVKPRGINPGTVRLVAQRLNHYATPGPKLDDNTLLLLLLLLLSLSSSSSSNFSLLSFGWEIFAYPGI